MTVDLLQSRQRHVESAQAADRTATVFNILDAAHRPAGPR